MDRNKYGVYGAPPSGPSGYPPQQDYYSKTQGWPQLPLYPPIAATAGPSSYPPTSAYQAGSSAHAQYHLPQQQQQQQHGAQAYAPQQYAPQQYNGYDQQYQRYHQAPPRQQHYGSKPQGPAGAKPPGGKPRGGPFTSNAPIAMDIESQAAMKFANTAIRNGFVRKVFGILSLQLLVTIGFTCFCLFYAPVKAYLRANPWPFYASWGVSLVLLLVLVCVESARRRYPANMLLLGAFTVAEAFLVGMISSFWDIEVVLMAFIATAAVVVGLMLFATQTRYDVTRWGSSLFIATIVLLAMTLIGLFWVNRILYLVIAGAGALLFSLYLIYDMQLIMGGRGRELSPDEYVFASLTLYIDIVAIFLYLMQIIGLSR